MKKPLIIFLSALVLLIIVYLVVSVPSDTEQNIDITGQWECSDANFCDIDKEKLSDDNPYVAVPIQINIDSDGTVTGKIGDAVLENATLKINRNLIGRYFNVKSDYMIEDAEIVGSIIDMDTKDTRTVDIHLNLEGDTINGSISLIEFAKYPDPVFSPFTLTKSADD